MKTILARENKIHFSCIILNFNVKEIKLTLMYKKKKTIIVLFQYLKIKKPFP